MARALAARLPFLNKGGEPDARAWSAELLKRLEWRRFEELCVAYYEAIGFKTRVSGTGREGGVDIVLYETRSDEPIALARCKSWDAYRVSAKPLRELARAMAEAGIPRGVLLSAGRFTQEAAQLAKAEGIELVDGAALLDRIAALPEDKAADLLRFATEGDYVTPTCPFCSIKMVPRRSTRDGWTFWGCPNYPACKKTFGAGPFAPD